MALNLDDEDYNGECFVLGSEGELEEEELSQILWFPPDADRPIGWAYTQTLEEANLGDGSNSDVYLNRTLWLNYNWIRANQGHIGERDAFRIAYLRMIVVREALANPNETAAGHHARYNLARFRSGTMSHAAPAAAPAGSDADWRKALRKRFTNIVCITAFFFRVRGHHFQEGFEERFKAVWRKCLYDEDDPGLRWEYVARNALHAIFPDDLDDFWRFAVGASRCAGALIKRFDSAPAGVAGVSAIRRGVNDISMILPRVPNLVPDAVEHLVELESVIKTHRWAGSVNRRFYNAPQVRIDESKLASLAAVIMAGLEQFAPNNPLSRSAALRRISANAPITGAVVARLIQTAVSAPEAADGLIKRIED